MNPAAAAPERSKSGSWKACVAKMFSSEFDCWAPTATFPPPGDDDSSGGVMDEKQQQLQQQKQGAGGACPPPGQQLRQKETMAAGMAPAQMEVRLKKNGGAGAGGAAHRLFAVLPAHQLKCRRHR